MQLVTRALWQQLRVRGPSLCAAQRPTGQLTQYSTTNQDLQPASGPLVGVKVRICPLSLHYAVWSGSTGAHLLASSLWSTTLLRVRPSALSTGQAVALGLPVTGHLCCFESLLLQVLDLGQVVAGNFCGAILAYFGADVIKVARSYSLVAEQSHTIQAALRQSAVTPTITTLGNLASQQLPVHHQHTNGQITDYSRSSEHYMSTFLLARTNLMAMLARCLQVEPPKGDALRSLRHLDHTGTSLWWRCHVSLNKH